MAAGLVLVRQRPGSAKGVMFITLEDETGIANLVVWPQMFEQFRRVVMGAGMIAAAARGRAGPPSSRVSSLIFRPIWRPSEAAT
jgi:DNA polymerase III alpha subunit